MRGRSVCGFMNQHNLQVGFQPWEELSVEIIFEKISLFYFKWVRDHCIPHQNFDFMKIIKGTNNFVNL